MMTVEARALALRVDVDPKINRILRFVSRYPRWFAWVGVNPLAWILVKLFVKVRACP